MKQKVNDSFVFYSTNLEMVEKLKETNPELANELLYAIAEYGIYGEYDNNNPIIETMMLPIVNGIDRAKGKYNAKKANVAQVKHYEEIANLFLLGKKQNEIAIILSRKFGEKISQQTISNRLGAIKRDFPELLTAKGEVLQDNCEEESSSIFNF